LTYGNCTDAARSVGGRYLRSSFEPHCEYLDGVLAPKPAPDYLHSKLQKLIVLLLASQEEKLGIEVLPEVHVRVHARRYRVPDVAGLVAPPADGRYPDADSPPRFTLEIVSREEPWPDIRAKLTDYLAMGVSLVIIADPYNKTVMLASDAHPLHELERPLLVNVQLPDARVLQIDFDGSLPAAVREVCADCVSPPAAVLYRRNQGSMPPAAHRSGVGASEMSAPPG
jgi:Uma2 family endonuclease